VCREDGQEMSSPVEEKKMGSESAPVPGTLEALSNAADTMVLWTLCRSGCLNFNSRCAILGALAVGTARTQMFPFAERAVATVTCAVQDSIGVEPG
jgi:hypothetical protein